MTPLLQQAFAAAAARPAAEQDVLATMLLAELDAEDAFDQKIAQTGSQLAPLAEEALAEHRAGRTVGLDPDRL
jgi:hypothetical protein